MNSVELEAYIRGIREGVRIASESVIVGDSGVESTRSYTKKKDASQRTRVRATRITTPLKRWTEHEDEILRVRFLEGMDTLLKLLPDRTYKSIFIRARNKGFDIPLKYKKYKHSEESKTIVKLGQ